MLNDLLQIKKVKEGDIGAFEGLFRKYHPPLLFYATGITGSTDAAEDIIQDLFYVLWRDRDKLQIFSSFKSYLYSAVRNRSLRYCEKKKSDQKYRNNLSYTSDGDSLSDSQERMEYQELEQIINSTLKKIPERRATIFRMHRFQNLKYREIADELSLSVKTVEAEMTKVLKTLKKEIETHTPIS
ncbi:MAG: RNA polymerase sigma-70 factor [Bacteroidales bacterium]|jgi:RNA polymerase sigma-70 factor (ECF subfamily)|nr:RNA polymerase sigma-70 factor [Bacteroidales bacterium]